ncbi:heme peroxidase [Phaeosphaeriaceae sp. PMI808]|nr:heme peroxidase [Phaeosphaeriaceae sp. PMI808]
MLRLFGRGKSHTETDDPKELFLKKLVQDVNSQLSLDRLKSNYGLLDAITDAAARGVVDDKEYVYEKLTQLLASLPHDSAIRDKATMLLLKDLWGNLEHPATSGLGDLYQYRTVDGSNNNIHLPNLGKAGSYYTRTVAPKHVPTSKPDAGVLFDLLLARKGEPSAHPTKISSMLFALASIIIHDVFRTSDHNKDIVSTSSYLDLSPLYGSNQASQDDVSVLLLCFNRFHNYTAEQLALINESGRFNLPSDIYEFDAEMHTAALTKRDHDLFQTARLVTCGLYVQIVLNDYVRTILNLQRTESSWNLDPRAEVLGASKVPKATGNQVSVEFNLIYRWHSTISTKNERWTNDHLSKLCPGVDIEKLTLEQLQIGMRDFAASVPADPGLRTFASLRRNPRGYFDDADLIRILTDATEDIAASFGPRQVPVALKVIEVMSIEQARSWGVATLNEMRSFFSMVPHKTFADIHSDPEISDAIQALYEHVDNVELYPGVVIEEPKIPMDPGSGLCPGFTTSKAILSDAVSLVRGDRFYTVDYTPHHLTAAGFKEVSSDPSIAGGGMMWKLLQRAFLPWKLGREADFTYDPPQYQPPARAITDYNTVAKILHDATSYISPWSQTIRQFKRHVYGPTKDSRGEIKQQKIVRQAILGQKDSRKNLERFAETTTSEFIDSQSHKLRDASEVDVIKHVAGSSWTQVVTHLIHFPVKNSPKMKAKFSDRELYDKMTTLYRYIYCDGDSSTQSRAKDAAQQAKEELTKELRDQKAGKRDFDSNYSDELMQRLLKYGKTVEESFSIIVLLATEIVVSGSLALPQMLNVLLSEPHHSKHWPSIQELASDTSPSASETLRAYVLEALRLSPPVAPLLRVSDTPPKINDWRHAQNIKEGDNLLLDIAAASRDMTIFPDPDKVKTDRSQALYLPFTDTSHGSLVQEIVVLGLTAQLRVFGKLKRLEKAPGTRGRIKTESTSGVTSFLSEAQDEWLAFPDSMKVHFDNLRPPLR